MEIEPHQLDFFHDAVERMRTRGKVEFAPGLTDTEIRLAELIYHFRFPPDLRAFLKIALPIAHYDYYGNRSLAFPNWRDLSRSSRRDIKMCMYWPRKDIFSAIEDWVWGTNWGERPERLENVLKASRREVEKAPSLIPVFGHRYLPAEPVEAGNPVFSIVESDIICYEYDLASYLCKEFHEAEIPMPAWAAPQLSTIKLWSDASNRNLWVRLGSIGLD